MRILGIDYGRRKIGLAIADGPLAEPWKVFRYEDVDEVIKKVIQVIKVERIERVVVGISEGEMGRESKKFSLSLSQSLPAQAGLKIPVETFDETLSTQDAQELSRAAGIKRKKRKELEDAYAAAVMLQSYLEVNHV